MLIVVKVLCLVAYIVGVGAVAIYSKPLAEEVGNEGMTVPVLAGIFWPALVAFGLLAALVGHIIDLVRGE